MIGPPPQAFRPSIASPSVGGSVIVTGDANIVVDPRGQIGIGRSLTAPPSHTTRHTGPYQGGSVWLHVVVST
jgi:hypothetical protein